MCAYYSSVLLKRFTVLFHPLLSQIIYRGSLSVMLRTEANSEGFFASLLDSFLSSLTEEDLTRLMSSQTNNRQLVDFVFDRGSRFFSVPGDDLEIPGWRGKDAESSRNHREAGNVAFRAGNISRAHLLYSMAALYAPVELKKDQEGGYTHTV